jgi:hypothetical protein
MPTADKPITATARSKNTHRRLVISEHPSGLEDYRHAEPAQSRKPALIANKRVPTG